MNGILGRRRWSRRLVLLLLLVGAERAAAQDLRGLEAGPEAAMTLASTSFAGAGLSIAIRPGGRSRAVLTLLPGTQDGRFAGRGEVIGQLLLAPAQRRGPGFYALAGVAGQVGWRDRGVLVLGLGVESSPGARQGWHLEAGIGGGFRLAAGWRWRWLHGRGPRMP